MADFLGALSASTKLVAKDLTSTPEPAPKALIASVAMLNSCLNVDASHWFCHNLFGIGFKSNYLMKLNKFN